MAIDPSISLSAKAPDSMANLSSLAGTATALQNLKKSKATFAADVAQRAAEARTAGANANVAEQTQQPLIAQQQAQTETAQTGAQKASFDLTNAKHQKTIEQITGLIGDEAIRNGDPKGISDALDSAAQNAIQYGSSPEEVQASIAPLKQLAMKNPKAVQPALVNMLRQGLNMGSQANVLQPSGPMINTGQVQYQANVNPLAAAPQGPIAGTGAVNQIPVGTQVFNAGANAPQLVGPGGMAGPQSGAALGVPENIKGTVDVVNNDFATTQANAANAQNAISILQNIKKYAHGAATGIAGTGGIASIASDIARVTGLSEGDVKANTDMLAKNANMLALTGGDTNLARTLAEAANPNTHMNPEAIRKAADQVMSIHELSLAKQKYIGQFKNDPQTYVQKLADFNAVADPRVFQLKNMSLKEKAEMKSSMTPAEQQQFGEILRKAESMGIVK